MAKRRPPVLAQEKVNISTSEIATLHHKLPQIQIVTLTSGLKLQFQYLGVFFFRKNGYINNRDYYGFEVTLYFSASLINTRSFSNVQC